MKATGKVLLLLCVMYFITYVDRVNVSTAAAAFGKEFHLSNTQIGLVFSAFAYPYLLFQVFGGWVGDRFGPHRTLTVCAIIWAGATIATGLVGGLASMLVARFFLGFGEGATFPTATRAMSNWTAPSRRGFAQGITHSFSRIGNAVTPPVVAWLMVALSWRGSFIVLGLVSLAWALVWGWYFRNDPRQHRAITPAELETLPAYDGPKERAKAPWGKLALRMLPVAVVYFCYGWTLWLFLSWTPSYFLNSYGLDIKHSALFASGIFFAGVVGDTLGGVLSDRILKRTGSLKKARRDLVIAGMLGALLSLLPTLFVHQLTVSAICLSLGFFFAEMTIGPMWSIPMDIAPKYSGTASGLMNTGSAMAAIVSPVVAGLVIDWTGNHDLPFVGSMALMLAGAGLAFFMHPERPFEQQAPAVPPAAAPRAEAGTA